MGTPKWIIYFLPIVIIGCLIFIPTWVFYTEFKNGNNYYLLLFLPVIGVLLYLATHIFVVRPAVKYHQILEKGVLGNATITSVIDTGSTINEFPKVKLILLVKPNEAESFITTCYTVVPRLNPYMYTVGMDVTVKIDLESKKVALAK